MSKDPKPIAAGEIVAVGKPTSHEIAERVAKIESARTLVEKSDILHAMTAEMRHESLGALPATTVAALIEGDPDRNITLLANLPVRKYTQILALGSFNHGRMWLERAATSGFLAASILPSLLNGRDLAEMMLTDPEFRRALPKLLNTQRAERWRQLLTTSEWHHHIDSLLMSDTDELLAKIKFKNEALKAVLQSLLDYVPELYLETIMTANERAKHTEDNPDELEDLIATPFGITGMDIPDEDVRTVRDEERTTHSPLADVIPAGGDPVFALATAGLNAARKAELEEQLKTLLRQEILATASFAQAAMSRAAGRVLAYLRLGLESYGSSVEDAARALDVHNLPEISAIGARAVESLRQKALALAGQRDWLDTRQRQFLEAMKTPEAGIHPQTTEPVLWLAGKPKQERNEWHPVPLADIRPQIQEISTWSALAHAAFGTPERVHAILGTAKTRTATEALRRTVVALAIYRRWEPELVRPAEDFAAFERQYGASRPRNLDPVRQIVLEALDQTPAAAWKPSDARTRARDMLLQTIAQMEKNKLEDPQHGRTR